MKKRDFIGLLICLIVLGVLSKDFLIPNIELEDEECNEVFIPKDSKYKIVGFYPSWRQDLLPIESINWTAFTRIVYAFGIPKADGQVDIRKLSQLKELVKKGHENGVEVFFSIGGGSSKDFPKMAKDSTTRKRFAEEVKSILLKYCLDGVDIDWEAWETDENKVPTKEGKENIVKTLRRLKDVLKPFGFKISVDVYQSQWSGRVMLDEVEKLVDDVQVMAYDFSGSWSDAGEHSAFSQAIGHGDTENATGLAYWVNYRKWQKSKLILGLPFYGRNFEDNKGAGIPYHDIIAKYENAHEADRQNAIYYNGQKTIKRKSNYIKNKGYGGVMIWEITQDVHDNRSLLKSVEEVFIEEM